MWLAVAAAALAQTAPPLLAARWLAPGADPVRALAYAPSECLARPTDPDAALAVEVGRAAFRTPLLLGGQAARAGLSCEACHRSGRGNPDFAFPGISGPPGTADVTHSLFSTRRGNGVHDPRPIPDLSGPAADLKVARTPDASALKTFTHGLVVEEFDGRAPPQPVMDGLVAYVRALDPAACPTEAVAPVRLAGYMDDARRAFAAADAMAGRGEPDTAAFLILAARSRLALIDERYAAFPGERARLAGAARRLGPIAEALRARDPAAPTDLRRWIADSHALERRLAAREPKSLFDPSHLAAAYGRRLPR
ncbi:hypothetical protein ACFODL_00035 [Phenylobacterium terrae]|uniref:Cytochrome c domain-containing protein n=1 Tax=Phenylobacterium terrae TaxID=2665495 RepID=A0ABW4MZG5_9CAUL